MLYTSDRPWFKVQLTAVELHSYELQISINIAKWDSRKGSCWLWLNNLLPNQDTTEIPNPWGMFVCLFVLDKRSTLKTMRPLLSRLLKLWGLWIIEITIAQSLMFSVKESFLCVYIWVLPPSSPPWSLPLLFSVVSCPLPALRLPLEPRPIPPQLDCYGARTHLPGGGTNVMCSSVLV